MKRKLPTNKNNTSYVSPYGVFNGKQSSILDFFSPITVEEQEYHKAVDLDEDLQNSQDSIVKFEDIDSNDESTPNKAIKLTVSQSPNGNAYSKKITTTTVETLSPTNSQSQTSPPLSQNLVVVGNKQNQQVIVPLPTTFSQESPYRLPISRSISTPSLVQPTSPTSPTSPIQRSQSTHVSPQSNLTPYKKTVITTIVEEVYTTNTTPSSSQKIQSPSPSQQNKPIVMDLTQPITIDLDEDDFKDFDPILSTDVVNQTTTTTTTTTTFNFNNNNSYKTNIDYNNENSSGFRESKYYLKDFLLVTETVYKRDPQLFNDSETKLIELMLGESLPSECKSIYVRLYNRKGPWFPLNLLESNYSKEILNIPQACLKLSTYGLLVKYSPKEHDYMEIANLLKVAQLKSIVGNLINARNLTKNNLMDIVSGKTSALLQKGQSQITTNQDINHYKLKIEREIGECFKIENETLNLWKRIHHLYFYSWHQHDARSIVINHVHSIQYPSYKMSQVPAKDRIFPNREALLEYEKVKELELTIFYESLEESNVASVIDQCSVELSKYQNKKVEYNFAIKFTPGWVYTRIMDKAVGVLEKMRKYSEAINYLMLLLDLPFCMGDRGHWYQRLVINSKHLNRMDDALVICERSLADDTVRSGDRLSLEKHLLQLSVPPRRWKPKTNLLKIIDSLKKIKYLTLYREKVSIGKSGHKAIYNLLKPIQVSVTQDGKPLESTELITSLHDISTSSVEGVAIEHYKSEDWNAIHCETSLFSALYILFFWDIIYLDVPNVFQSPFQDAPLDFGSQEFYYQRKSIVDKKLLELTNSSPRQRDQMLGESWKNNGCIARGINWESYSLGELCSISKCLGGGLISFICKLFLEDYLSFSKGMPDLFLWKSRENGDFIKFVEVKGQGDTLRDHQKIWIDMLISFGVDVEICSILNKN